MLAMKHDYLSDSATLNKNKKLLYRRIVAISEDARETEFAMSDDSLEYLLTSCPCS